MRQCDTGAIGERQAPTLLPKKRGSLRIFGSKFYDIDADVAYLVRQPFDIRAASQRLL